MCPTQQLAAFSKTLQPFQTRTLRLPPKSAHISPHAHLWTLQKHRPACRRRASPVACSAGWPLWTSISAIAAVSQVVERRTAVGALASAPLLATLLALGAAAAGLIPTASPVYSTIWEFLLPLAAALYLLECDISGLFGSAGSAVLAFFNGALGTVLGTVVAYALVGRQLGPEGSKVAAALCASYIGGSLNFAAVSRLLEMQGPALAAAMTADNVAMAAYLTVLYLIPATMSAAAAPGDLAVALGKRPGATSESVAVALAAAALACTLGNAAAAAAGFASSGLAFTALAASALAAIGGAAVRLQRSTRAASALGVATDPAAPATPFTGAEAVGGALMMFFFATIGAAAGGIHALKGSGWLLLFILVQLSVQLLVALGLGRAMKLPMPVILVTANANVGGPATAAAMAASKGWRGLVQPGLLTGSLGYAVANGVGWAMGTWLRGWFVF